MGHYDECGEARVKKGTVVQSDGSSVIVEYDPIVYAVQDGTLEPVHGVDDVQQVPQVDCFRLNTWKAYVKSNKIRRANPMQAKFEVIEPQVPMGGTSRKIKLISGT